MLLELLRWTLFSPEDRVLVAVSGGPDSLSLLHALHVGRDTQGLASVEAAHLDHGLRGEESAAEAAWVAAWCAERGIPCHRGLADVAALSKAHKRSKQEAAREARYHFLAATAETSGANKIATGHTQDDQVETVLLNILRGTGTDGLSGIPAAQGLFVRPLRDVSRAGIEEYCLQHSLTPRRDPSNFSPDAYTRNRLRLELLPQLARDYNPAVREALLRLSEIAARDSDFLHRQAETVLPSLLREQASDCMVVDRAALVALHPALTRSVLRLAIRRLRGTVAGVTYDHIEAICRALEPPPIQAFGLSLPQPFCLVRVTAKAVTLTLPRVSVLPAPVSVLLPVPCTASLPGTGWTVSAGFEAAPGAVALDADVIQGTILTLRNWRQGDRIAPAGMGGHHKKVSDIFADNKVSRTHRHTIPIVTDDDGILWIAGLALAERARVTETTTRRLFLNVMGQKPRQEGKSLPSGE